MKKLLLLSLALFSLNLYSKDHFAISSFKENLIPELVCTINCPNDIVVNLDPGACEAEVGYTVTASMCTGSIVQTAGLPSGSTFPVGTTTNCFQIQSATCCFNVTVNEYPNPTTVLACNDNVQVSVDENCEAFIETDMILEGGPYACYNDYLVSVQGYGSGFGGVIVNSNAVGQTLSVTVTDPETGNFCFGTISVEDKVPPIVTCPPTVNFAACDMTHPNITGHATAVDNCTNTPLITFSDQDVTDICPGIGSGIFRTWTATDESGNYAQCVQQIGERCQAHHIFFNDVTSTSISLEWTNGNGDYRIVEISTSPAFLQPVNGLTYSFDTEYQGSNQQIVYVGSGDNVTVTNLTPNKTYWFHVYEAYCYESSPSYYLVDATGNPKSQKTSDTGAQINNIALTNVIDLHQSIPTQHTLYSGSMASIKPLKVCADGTTATYIKVTVNSTQGINFQILDQQGIVVSDALNQIHTNTSKFGKLGTPNVFGNNVEVSYTAPELMDLDGATHRTLSIRVLKDGSPIPGSIFPLYIFRPPIVFIHGLWGKGSAFKEMESTFYQESVQNYDLMFRMDYSANRGASKSFKKNTYVLPNSIDEAFRRIRLKNYSASKVDIIAHSMGGILSRIYLQKTYGSNGYRNDINKLITIDSPFGGTPSANCLLNSINKPVRDFLANFPILKYCEEGAVEDLNVNSTEISNLQSDHLKHHGVALYPIQCTVPFDEANYDDGAGDKSLIYFVYWINFPHYQSGGLDNPQELAEYIYFNESGDLVVPSTSQIGNTSLYNHTPFTDVHTESKDNPDVIDFIKNKLFQNPNNNLEFNKSGFGTLDVLNVRDDSIVPNDEALSFDTIEQSIIISSPSNMDSFGPGDGLNISIEGTNGIKSIFATAVSTESGLIIGHSESNILHLETEIPVSYNGPIWIYAIGKDANNSFYLDSVKVESTSNSTIDSISIYPKPILIGNSITKAIEITAFYSNGSIRNLGYDTNLICQISDTTICKYLGNLEFEGIDTGQTSLIVSYQGYIDSTKVIVYPFEAIYVAAIETKSNHLCLGDTIEFVNGSTGSPDSIFWNFQGGLPPTSKDQMPFVSYLQNGDFDVQLIAFYPEYSDTMVLQNYIHVFALPEANIASNNGFAFCHGDSIQLTSSIGSSYNWNSGENTQSINVDSAGLYFVELTDSLGCTNVSEPTEVIVWEPMAEISYEGDSIICHGDSILLLASDAIDYLWSTGDTTNSIFISNTGIYSVTCTDQNGCVATSSPVEIIQADSIFALISNSQNTICQGDTLVLASSPAFSYLWNTGATTDSIIVFSEGEYSLTVTDQNGCSSASIPVSIFVSNLPLVDLGADTTVYALFFSLDAGADGIKYIWNTEDSTQMIIVTSTGQYSVTVVDSNGCHAFDTIFVELITANSYINELDVIRLYPNPNFGVFHLECQLRNPGKLGYEIYDQIGRLVASDLLESMAERVNTMVSIPNASSGIYYLRLRLGSNSYVVKLAVL